MKSIILKILIIVSVFVFVSCKKEQRNYESQIQTDKFENFFKLPDNSPMYLIKIVEKLKEMEQKDPGFIKSIINKHGYPSWKNFITNFDNANLSRTTTNDSIIHIPLVQTNDSMVNSAFKITLTQNTNIEVNTSNGYINYSFDKYTNQPSDADKYTMVFFKLSNNVFNKRYFKIIDNRLFSGFTSLNDTLSDLKVFYYNEANTTSRDMPLDCGTIVSFDVEDNCPHTGVCEQICDGCSSCIQATPHSASLCPDTYNYGGTSAVGGSNFGGSSTNTGWTGMTQQQIFEVRANLAVSQYPGMSWAFTNNADPNNSYYWDNNPSSWAYYLNNTLCAPNTFQFSYDNNQTNILSDTPTVSLKVNRSASGGENVYIKITKGTDGKYKGVSVSSSLYGFSLGISWKQLSATTITHTNELIEVDLYGEEEYYVFFVPNFPTVWTKEVHYKIFINRITGSIIHTQKID
jgi:hypothetical protein